MTRSVLNTVSLYSVAFFIVAALFVVESAAFKTKLRTVIIASVVIMKALDLLSPTVWMLMVEESNG